MTAENFAIGSSTTGSTGATSSDWSTNTIKLDKKKNEEARIAALPNLLNGSAKGQQKTQGGFMA